MKERNYRIVEGAVMTDDSLTDHQRQSILDFCANIVGETSKKEGKISIREKAHHPDNSTKCNISIVSPYFTTKQAAKYMNRSISWMLHRKDIPYYRGKSNSYRKEDLDEWMNKHRRHEPKAA